MRSRRSSPRGTLYSPDRARPSFAWQPPPRRPNNLRRNDGQFALPPFLHNTGQRGEFVLLLNIPSATGGAEDKYDDFHLLDAAA